MSTESAGKTKPPLPTSSRGKNLEAIVKAIECHNKACTFNATAVALNPFEYERLGWDEIAGVSIISDHRIGTGRFRVICERHKLDNENVEAVSSPVEERQRERVPA